MVTMNARGALARLGRQAVRALLVASLVSVTGVPVSTADDASAFRDLVTASDFRLRVVSALALGKSREPGARTALEKALGDTHPAVRAAAAAALGNMGSPASIPALKGALSGEKTANVKSQIEATLARLPVGSSGSTAKAKFLIAVGRLENKSGVSGKEIAIALKSATRAKMAQVPGVEVVAEGTDVGAVSRSRGLPGFTLDGSLIKLAKKQGADGVGYAARVEYLLRKMPEQALKGTMSGNAQAVADAHLVRSPSELNQLQMDAVSAAIESALKGVSPTLEAASH
jgi:HEAT repeats